MSVVLPLTEDLEIKKPIARILNFVIDSKTDKKSRNYAFTNLLNWSKDMLWIRSMEGIFLSKRIIRSQYQRSGSAFF